MEPTEDLLEKFFRKECTPQEEELVRDYLRQYWAGLEKKLTEEDWADFRYLGALPPGLSDKMLSEIDKSIEQGGKDKGNPKGREDKGIPQGGETAVGPTPNIRRIGIRWASAAAIILCSLAVWIWVRNSRQSATRLADMPSIASAHHWKEMINKTGKTMLLVLPDSSTVELADRSSIRYEDSFSGAARAIYLEGKGLFTVASDPARPFTVYTTQLSTTALATVFSVNSMVDGTTETEVCLLSGKVVVRPDSLLRSRGIRETFLLPGQQLKFDPLKMTVLVHNAGSPKTKPSPFRTVKPLPEKIMRFNDTPLKDIFRTLENSYHCRFDYQTGEIGDIRFTGSFNSEKETLSDFLNTIALLNNLTVTEKNNTYYLK